MEQIDSRPRVVIACPGLDHAGRGFETLARECFAALRAEGSLDVWLVKGSGERGPGELVARTVRRDSMAARAAGRALRRGTYAGYDVEQLGFSATMLPRLRRLRPQVVCLSDLLTSRALAKWRSLTRSSFKLVVSNGGPWAAHHLSHADHVQQLTPAALESALGSGADAGQQTLLPLGVDMAPEPDPLSDAERDELRRGLDLPVDRRIALSVGALNRYDKRLDYLIEEVASMPPPRPLLVLLGAEEAETPAIRALAGSLLGPSGAVIRTVPSDRVRDYYRAADVFVLASLVEAFGRVMVEAMSHGLPCVVHDGPVQRYVTGPHGFFGDLRRRGELARLLSRGDVFDRSAQAVRERHRYVHERFSWEVLAPRYAALLRDCARRPRTTHH